MSVPKPNAESLFDTYLSTRSFPSLPERTVAEVRRLTRHPAYGIDILSERVTNGVHALDEIEAEGRAIPERHWELFELIANAWRCCDIAIERYNAACFDAELARLRLKKGRRRRTAETLTLGTILGGEEPPATETEKPVQRLIRRQ